jgi:16S rRNA G966 N2-methylase RsmD
VKSTSNGKAKIHLIEIEPQLQELCKKYGTLVAYDFLTFEPDTNYDYIFLNPPFSNGDEHLLKAWDIAKNTTIVCILNAETVRNPYSQKRKALQAIIDDF